MSVSAPPFVPAKMTSGVAVLLTAQLLHDAGDVRRLDVEPMAVVHGDDRRPAAAAEALDSAQAEPAVLGRLAGADAELALERLHHVLRAAHAARDVRADLDVPGADGLEVEHVVERCDREAVRRRQVERV